MEETLTSDLEKSDWALRDPLGDAWNVEDPPEVCRDEWVVLQDLEALVHWLRQRGVEGIGGVREGVKHLEEAQVPIGQLE